MPNPQFSGRAAQNIVKATQQTLRAPRDQRGNYLPTSSPQKAGIFPVITINDGGTYGSDSTTCNATYTVKDITDNDLPDGSSATSTMKTPIWNVRFANTYYSGPTSTLDFGAACYDLYGNLKLLQVVEKPFAEACSAYPNSSSSVESD